MSLLQAVAELPEEALRLGLAHLQDAEFLYEARLFPELVYTFKHALTQQVAYETLLQERRRTLHARIVEALEALAGDRVVEQAERLAHHALRGELWDKALAYCRQAGEKAMARSAHREAVEYFEQALSVLPHLPEQRATREQAIDLRVALRSALRPLGDFERILAALREAETLATALADSRRLGQVSHFLSNCFYFMGAYDQAIAAAQRALAFASTSGEDILHALANLYLGVAYTAQGDYRRAVDCHRQTVASLDGARRRERFGEAFLPAVFSHACLAHCHAELGTFAEGRAFGDEGLRIAETVDHPGSLMWAYWGIGLLSLCQGDLHRALPLLERAVDLSHEADLPAYFPRMAAALGAAYALDERGADAVPLLTQALEQSTTTARAHYETLCSFPWGRPICWPIVWRRHRSSPSAHWRSPGSTRNVATRRTPSDSSARSTRIAILQKSPWLKLPTTKPWPWPTNWACVRSWPTATAVSVSCIAGWDEDSKRVPPCPRPSRCTGLWRWPSGYPRLRRH